MRKVLFKADGKSDKVEALNILIDAKASDLKVLVNGVDLSDMFKIELLEIFVEKVS